MAENMEKSMEEFEAALTRVAATYGKIWRDGIGHVNQPLSEKVHSDAHAAAMTLHAGAIGRIIDLEAKLRSARDIALVMADSVEELTGPDDAPLADLNWEGE